VIGNIRGVAAALLGGMALLLAGGSSARAQYVDPAARRDYSIKVGAFVPLKKEVRTAARTYSLAFEGDVVIQRFPERSLVSIASVGYIERGGYRMIPITVGQIYRDPGSPSPVRYFYGYGLGIYSTRLNVSGETSNKVKNLFGGYLVTGIDFSERTFGELKYQWVSRYDRKDPSGFQVSYGMRF
jgi:hypothetical protein